MSAETTPFSIPSELRPSDGRFGSGPSKVPQEAVTALAAAAPGYLGTSHRRPGVRDMVARVRSGLHDLLQLPGDYEIVLGNGGAAYFWDVTAFSLVRERSQHLVFGEFSSSFANAIRNAPHLAEPEIIEAPYGTCPQGKPTAGIDVYALTQNETSTGVCAPVERLAGDGLVVVDATSAAGGMAVDPAQFDVYFFSPQKCFAADGGLWLAALSPAAIERVADVTGSGRAIPSSLSLAVALDNSRKEQTYNTPALATLFLLAHEIDAMRERGGLAWATGRCQESASIVYGWAEASAYATPFVAEPSQRSTTVATIDFDDAVDAAAVAKALRANGIVDTEPYRKLGRNQLRLAMFPEVDPRDLERLTKAIDATVQGLGAHR